MAITANQELGQWLTKAGYEYGCFLSWPRRTKQNQRVVEGLEKEVKDRLSQRNLLPKVFLDRKEIQSGQIWEKRLREALPKSLTLVALCDEQYYASKWCGRELQAMRELGKHRGLSADESGIILLKWLPDPLPKVIADIQAIDLTEYELWMGPHVASSTALRTVATRIAETVLRTARAAHQAKKPAAPKVFQIPNSPFAPGEADARSGRPATKAEGRIVTFYSYKGGVGRSMAVANIGRLLARRADTNVLLVDWDLEAPGLPCFFPGAHGKSAGLLNYLSSIIQRTKDNAEFANKIKTIHGTATLNKSAPIAPYISATEENALWLLKAGLFDSKSSEPVRGFDWNALYRDHPAIIPALRRLLKQKFTYTLLDARTGESDVNGMTTALLPDVVVAVYAPTQQNLDGVIRVLENVLQFRRGPDGKPPVIVYPVPSRFDDGDLRKLQGWHGRFKERFQNLFQAQYGLTHCNLEPYFQEVMLRYVSHYAYGEHSAVEADDPDYPGSLRRGYEALAEWIASGRAPWEAKRAG